MSTPIAEGKTKEIHVYSHGLCRIVSKDDTTAGDGARREVIEGKAEISTRMSVNTFGLLHACGIPVGFRRQDTPISFIAPLLTMIPIEAVGRIQARGSYLQRHPRVREGHQFPTPVVELFLKTKDKEWMGHQLQCDDPLMVDLHDGVELYNSHKPFTKGTFFTRLKLAEAFPVPGSLALLPAVRSLTYAISLILEHAWELVGEGQHKNIEFADFKCEFGLDRGGRLMVGDVIDGDSCRILVDGEHADKQKFRDGATVEMTKLALEMSARLSDDFAVITSEMQEWVKERFTFVSCVVPALRAL